MAKYYALALLAIGVILISIAMNLKSKSVDDDSILYQILLGIAGVLCILGGIGIFAVRIFMAL